MFLVVDVETANMTNDALVYDIGYAICDRKGDVVSARSFIIKDIFELEKELMETAYYAKKIPLYLEKIESKESEVIDFMLARHIMKADMKKYGVKKVFAYNAKFDRNALDNTLRFLTKSKFRWFFPYGTEINCIWNMACQVIFTQKSFLKMAILNDWVSPAGNLQTSAEIAFRYMKKDEFFEEEHTGLADVLIEVEIMAKCFAQHKTMKKSINPWCWRTPTSHHKKNNGFC